MQKVFGWMLISDIMHSYLASHSRISEIFHKQLIMTLSYEVGVSFPRAVRRKLRSSHEVSSSFCKLYLIESSQKPKNPPRLLKWSGFNPENWLQKEWKNWETKSQEEQSRYPLLSPGMEGQMQCCQVPGQGCLAGSMGEVRPSMGMLTKVRAGDGEKYPGFSLPLALHSCTSSSSQWLNLEAGSQGSLGNAFPYHIGLDREGPILNPRANIHCAEINDVVVNRLQMWRWAGWGGEKRDWKYYCRPLIKGVGSMQRLSSAHPPQKWLSHIVLLGKRGGRP